MRRPWPTVAGTTTWCSNREWTRDLRVRAQRVGPGRVNSAASVLYEPEAALEYHIENTGGLANDAHNGHIGVRFAGSSARVSHTMTMDRRTFLAFGMGLPLVGRGPWLSLLPRAVSPSQTLTNLRLNDTLGVNIHGDGPDERQLDAVTQAGFHWVRNDLVWARTERTRGVFDFSLHDQYFAALARRGLRAYTILDYGNPAYDAGAPPVRGHAAFNAFLRYVRAAVSRYQSLVSAWEIWNEPNSPGFWRPTPNAAAYADLCTAAASAIRTIAPSATIIGGALAHAPNGRRVDFAFLDAVARAGGFAKVDIVSIHPYRFTPPESAQADLRQAETMIQSATGRSIPVIAGEWGYSTAVPNRLTPEMQAAYLVRMMLTNFAAGRPMTIWYNLVQSGPDPTSGDDNYGILHYQTLTALPAFTAATVLHRIAGFATSPQIEQRSGGVWVLSADRQGVPLTIVWATSGAVSLSVEIPNDGVGFDIDGTTLWSSTTGTTSHSVSLGPSSGPIYILGGPPTISS